MTREFLLGEAQKPSVESYIQSILETLNAVIPRSQRDTRRVELAKSNLSEVRRHCRKMQEQIKVLEEQVNILEENKES
jgi:flagellar biosynthesis chaperone FliJ